MSRSERVRSVLSSRITGFLLARPRLTITLVMLVALVALQGGAVAGGGETTVGTMDDNMANPGP
jgi:hypothetical protein